MAENRTFRTRTFRIKMKTDISFTKHFVPNVNKNAVETSSKRSLYELNHIDLTPTHTNKQLVCTKCPILYLVRNVLCTNCATVGNICLKNLDAKSFVKILPHERSYYTLQNSTTPMHLIFEANYKQIQISKHCKLDPFICKKLI